MLAHCSLHGITARNEWANALKSSELISSYLFNLYFSAYLTGLRADSVKYERTDAEVTARSTARRQKFSSLVSDRMLGMKKMFPPEVL